MKAGAGRKVVLLTGVVCGTILLAGCGAFLEMPVGDTQAQSPERTTVKEAGWYEITDRDLDTLEYNVTEIDLESPGEDENGRYSYRDGVLSVSAGGDYALKGKFSGGRLVVNVFEDEIVHFILDNVEIRSDSGAAICVEKAQKVIITAKEGTENVLTDGPKHDTGDKACVFSDSDLTVNGAGSLAIYGYHGDGIRSRDQVKIMGAHLYVKAKGDGIRGNDGVILTDSAVEIECEGNGLMADSEKDMVVIERGSCKVIAGKNAITARKYVAVRDSQTDLYSVWESIKCDGIIEPEAEAAE